MIDPTQTSRRSVLEHGATAGGLVLGGVATAGCLASEDDGDDGDGGTTTDDDGKTSTGTDQPDEYPAGSLMTLVDSWEWYPEEPTLWSRSSEPFDFEEGDGRWLAQPTSDGAVRCRVENDNSPGNAGVRVPLGQLGDVGRVTIETETQTSDGANPQIIGFALYLDANGDGEYFVYEAVDGREQFTEFAGDMEGLSGFPAGGSYSIDETTELELLPQGDRIVTVADLQSGAVEGVDAQTEAALYVGILGSGSGNTEEALIKAVTLEEAPLNDTVTDKIARDGQWAWYPEDSALWSRSTEPYDMQENDGRWLAEPAAGGSVRCLVENDSPPGNAGFYIDLGRVGDVDEVTCETETVNSDGDGPQQILFGFYFDVDGDGDYFVWEDHDATTERFSSLGDDAEALGMAPADGPLTIGDDTELQVIPPGGEYATFGEIKNGDVNGITAETHTALQLSVAASGMGNTEEALIHGVNVERS